MQGIRGKWIVLEGRDGSGKSSLRRELSEILERQYPGRDIFYTREAGGTPIAERLRELIIHGADDEKPHTHAEMLMFFAARLQLYREVIIPALNRGALVVSDRNWISSLMYQGYGNQEVEQVRGLMNLFLRDIPEPDLYLYLDVNTETANHRTRVARAYEDNIDSRGPEFFARVQTAYRNWALDNPQNVAILDANQSLQHVTDKAWERVLPLLEA